MIHDIIPDIHGHSQKLLSLLKQLGYSKSKTSWNHADKDRNIVFLGDFIDRGDENECVIRTVRELMDSGIAQAVIGNHELNAIHFHSINPHTNFPVREHNKKNVSQHKAFLEEFPLGALKTKEQIDWMKTLPLYIDFGAFRAVHACWSDEAVKNVSHFAKNGVLPGDLLIEAGDEGHSLFSHVETLTKGPEIELPEGYSFHDKGGHERRQMRAAWWRLQAKSYKEIAISVTDMSKIPDVPLPENVNFPLYAEHEKPVFFGHYWMTGKPVLQSHNALCLDYSAGAGGDLIAYQFDPKRPNISLDKIIA